VVAKNITSGWITIGCRTETVEWWDAWFAGTEELETTRGTEAFDMIQAEYEAARLICNQPGGGFHTRAMAAEKAE